MRPRIKQLDNSLHLIASLGPSDAEVPLSVAVGDAISMGATGIQTSVWTTKDGVLVANRTGHYRKKFRRVAISNVKASDLDSSCCPFSAIIDIVGPGTVQLVLGDEDSIEATIAAAQDAQVEDQLWLLSDDLALLTRWRTRTTAKLLQSVRLKDLKQGPERFAADLKDRMIDGFEMFHTDWNGGLVTMVHRFGLLASAVEAEHPREMANLIDAGIDSLRSERIGRLVETGSQFTIGRE